MWPGPFLGIFFFFLELHKERRSFEILSFVNPECLASSEALFFPKGGIVSCESSGWATSGTRFWSPLVSGLGQAMACLWTCFHTSQIETTRAAWPVSWFPSSKVLGTVICSCNVEDMLGSQRQSCFSSLWLLLPKAIICMVVIQQTLALGGCCDHRKRKYKFTERPDVCILL